LHFTNFHSTILANGVYIVISMSNPSKSVVTNAFMVITYFFMITIDTIPLIFSHFVNSWNLEVCD
jgi:hypothetical protein